MKLKISVILILSFTIISVLGVQMVFNHKDGHNGTNCLASKILFSEDCLNAGNAFLFASFHIGAFKSFALAENIFAFQFFALSLILLSSVYFSALFTKNLKIIPVFYYNKRYRERFFVLSQKEYKNWLALHESRDRRPSVWVA